MTVYQMINNLKALAEQGYGDCTVKTVIVGSDWKATIASAEQVEVIDFGTFSEIFIEGID